MSPDAPTLPPPAVPAQPVTPKTSRRRVTPRGVAGESLALRRLFWTGFAVLAVSILIKAPGQTPESVLGASLIVAASLLPSYLWVIGRVRGLPLFPACALTCIWAFGFPLVSEHPIVLLFPAWNQLVAALSVTGFLITGTLAWHWTARRPVRRSTVCWTMNEAQSGPLLLLALGLCTVWTIAETAGWIRLSTAVISLTRAVLLAIEALVCFVLSYRVGGQRLPVPAKATFFALLGILLISNLPGLLLIVDMSLLAIALMAYVVASKRLPWRVGLVALAVFGFLHFGKGEMREKHWHEDEDATVKPLQYPGFLSEWVQASWEVARKGDTSEERGESLLERASLMHWLLYIQASTPGMFPYLNGATYAVIPRMFVPRLFDPDKPRSHEGTYLIAIHYGIQTREDTETTTIAFGLLNEAYANFGYLGIGALGIVLGAFYGGVAHWARGMPILSFRALFAMLVASYSFQAEYTSTFYVAALFQSTVVLLVLAVIFMRKTPVSSGRTSLLD